MSFRKRGADSRRGPSSAERGPGRTSSPKNKPTLASYAGLQSLLRLPMAPAEGAEVDVLLSGVPFDGGSSYRPGARFGPQAVREASALARSYSPALGVDIADELLAADGGDVVGTDVEATLAAVAARAEELARSGVIGGFVGGDQTLTLGALRGIRRAKHKSVALLHLDAHPNTASLAPSALAQHTSVIRSAVEEGLVRNDAALQIGVRGPYVSSEDVAFLSTRGFEVVGVDEVRWDLHAVVGQVRKLVGRGALYVSVDVSVVDPSAAPGTGLPSPGGITTWELQQLLRALVGAEIIGFDVVEIAPVYDPSGITAALGVTVLHELLAAIADTRRSARPAPSTHRVSSRGRKLSP